MSQGRRHVHDFIAHTEEQLGILGFGEEISKIVTGIHVWHCDLHVLNALADEEVPPLHVLHAPGMLWVVGNCDGGFVVDK